MVKKKKTIYSSFDCIFSVCFKVYEIILNAFYELSRPDVVAETDSSNYPGATRCTVHADPHD